TTALAMAPAIWSGSDRQVPRVGRQLSWHAVAGVVLVAIALSGSAAAAHTGRTVGWRYLKTQESVREEVLTTSLEHPEGMTWSLAHGRAALTTLFPNPAEPRI